MLVFETRLTTVDCDLCAPCQMTATASCKECREHIWTLEGRTSRYCTRNLCYRFWKKNFKFGLYFHKGSLAPFRPICQVRFLRDYLIFLIRVFFINKLWHYSTRSARFQHFLRGFENDVIIPHACQEGGSGFSGKFVTKKLKIELRYQKR